MALGDGERALRVLTMVDSLDQLGGAEILAAQIAIRLDRDRFTPLFCVTRTSSGPLVQQLRAAGVPVAELRRTSRRSFWRWAGLLRLLRREQVDVLHSHMVGSNVWGTVFGRLARVPALVAHEHTWSYEGQAWRRWLDRDVIARGTDVLVAVSEADRRRMIELEGIPPAKTLVVPNGIPPLAEPTGRDFRTELEIPADAPVLGTACRLTPQKAIDVLIRAVALLREHHPEVRVLVAGDGPQEGELRALASELGLDDAVVFVGRVAAAEMPDFLAALDVAVNSSDFEGSSLGVLEFMAAGKPIVATAVGGTPDLIRDGEHGLLVPARDPEAFAAAVASLLDDRERAASLGTRARERQRSEFDLDGMVRRLEELYRSLYAESSRRR
jgi:glycosyltransferase involved in cell wall biosynthesis